jgi:hypothetical protein
MPIQGQVGEEIGVLGTIDPIDLATGASSTDWVAFDKFDKLGFYLMLGVISGTVDMKLQHATDGSGTGAADISGKAITQIADTGDAGQAVISIDRNEMAATFTHVKAIVTVTGGAVSLGAVLILGAIARYKPIEDHDLASVAEIIN